MNICDMTPGSTVTDVFLVRDVRKALTKNASEYLTITLADANDTISAKLWNYNSAIPFPEAGTVVYVEGTVEPYMNNLQVVLSVILPISKEEITKYKQLSELIPTAPIAVQDEINYIGKVISSMNDVEYQSVCQAIWSRHFPEFAISPAAKSIHHAFCSGLLMHTANMLRLAQDIVARYGDAIDADLLLAGVILHDMGKTVEFELTAYGLVKDYTAQGKLLGHPVLCAEEIGMVGKELYVSEEHIELLQHLVLSHHGKPEHGAAVRPMCLEAELLSQIDSIDSRAEIYRMAVKSVELGAFTDKIYALDKCIYRHR